MQKVFLPVLISLLFLSSCLYYQPRLIPVDDLRENHLRTMDMKKRKIYIHDEGGTYALDELEISDSIITGMPHQVLSKKELDKINQPDRHRDQKAHRSDIHLYLNKNIQPLSADVNNGGLLNENGKLSIRPSDIEKASIFKIDKKRTVEIILLYIVLAVFGAIILTYLLVSLLVLASGEVSGQSTNASGQSSGNSNSNSGQSSGNGSNSNSGGSNSGDSGSGGSNSGCYIATMVYGNYDAPEVLVLRKFRDEVLAGSLAGRTFIKVYYALSPSFVNLFRNSNSVNCFCKFLLDNWVNRLSGK